MSANNQPIFPNPQQFAFAAILAFGFCIGLEGGMFIMFLSIYNETIGLMSETYLSELPVVGQVFEMIDPDASASHIISALLAVFSVGTPVVIWNEIFRQHILDDPQEWFSHPQNQIIASLAGVILALVIGMEVTSLFTLIARETASGGFVTETGGDEIMDYLAQNKGMAIGVSIVIATINIVLALFTTRAVRALKPSS